jgi:hypothetical protein
MSRPQVDPFIYTHDDVLRMLDSLLAGEDFLWTLLATRKSLPADRRPIGRPFNLCSYFSWRRYFRDGHETDAHNCIEIASVCPLGQAIPGCSRI